MKTIYEHTGPRGIGSLSIKEQDDGGISVASRISHMQGWTVLHMTRQELADMHADIGAYLHATEPPAWVEVPPAAPAKKS